jgi:hypothetical protein
VADRIYVTYTPTGAPGSFHTAVQQAASLVVSIDQPGEEGLLAARPKKLKSRQIKSMLIGLRAALGRIP